MGMRFFFGDQAMVPSGIEMALESGASLSLGPDVVVTAIEPIAEELPRRHDPAALLVPNYPNPFAECTTLSFTLSRAGQVRLSVYDLMGWQVAVVMSGHFEAGAHSVVV